MDAALIDGDHNWYTVYNELQLLAEVAREAGAPLPVLIMHDVGWPYGRRDLYYAPEQIPEEFRQPYAQRGMRPGHARCCPRRRAEPDDVQRRGRGRPAQRRDDRARRLHRRARPAAPASCVLPIYFGLAIVVEEERLARQPELAAALDRLEGAEGQHELLELAEDIAPRGRWSSSTTSSASAAGAARRARRAATSSSSRRRCSTSTTSRTRSG